MSEPEEPAPEAPVAKRRRRRWLRFVVLALLLLPPFLIIGAVLTLPWWLPPERVERELEEILSETLAVEVDLGAIHYHPLSGITIEGLRIGPPEGFSRDVARIQRIELHYSLSGILKKRLVLERLRLTEPHVVIETRSGTKNVQAIAARFAGGPPPPEEPPGPIDRSGPVSPVSLTVREIAIRGLGVELDGEGPRVRFGALDVGLAAVVDAKRLDAALALRITKPDHRAKNLSVVLPEAPDAPERSIDADVLFTLGATVAADASAGLTLERSGLSVDLRVARAEVRGADLTIPPLDIAAWTGLSLEPDQDRVAVPDLGLSIAGQRVIEARVLVDGLVALLESALGPSAARTRDLLGLRPRGPGVVAVEVPAIALDLAPLEPYVRGVFPGATLGGAIALRELGISGTLGELQGLSPRHLEGELRVEDVSAEVPTLLARLGPIGGAFRLQRGEQSGMMFGGGVLGGPIRFGPHEIGHLSLALDSRVERLRFPELGTSTVTLTLAAEGVRSPPARIDRLRAFASLDGTEVLAERREGLAPVRARAALGADRIRVQSGTTAIALDGLTFDLGAELDHLVVATTAPIAARLGLRARRIALPGATSIEGLDLSLGAGTIDPRAKVPLDVTLDLKTTIGAIAVPDARLTRASVRLGARATGIDLLAPPTAPLTARLPATVALEGRVALPSVHTDAASVGTYDTSAGLELDLTARPREQTVNIKRLRVSLADLLHLRLSGTARRVLSEDRWIDLALALEPLDLGRATLPPAVLTRYPGIKGAGKLAFEATAKGRVVTDAAVLLEHLDAPPLQVQAKLSSEDLGIELPSEHLSVAGLTSDIELKVLPGRTEIGGDLSLAHAAQKTKFGIDVRDLQLHLEAGLRDQVWQIASSLVAGQLRSPHNPKDVLRGSHVDLDVVYPLFKNLEIRRFDVRLPDAGVDLSMNGRLERRRFGVLRPVFSVDFGLDADRLFAASLVRERTKPVPLRGRLRARLNARSPEDQRIDLAGAIELDRLSYETVDLRLSNATGRLPFEQRVVLPVIGSWLEERETDPGGKRPRVDALEELRVRIEDLVVALRERGKLYLEPIDIAVKSPRTADYEALRPFYATGARPRLTIDRLVYGLNELRALSLDALYKNGVLQLDRFAMQVWQGDIFGEMAVQLAGEDHLRFRLRSTVTDLNLDIPAATALGVQPVTAKGARDDYLVSGNVDLRVDLKEKAINGYFELNKMSTEMMVKIIDAMDPKGKDQQLQQTKSSVGLAVSFSDVVSTWLSGVTVVIRQNLMNLDFVWSRRLYNPLSVMFGSFVVNAARPIRRYSLSPFLENPAIGRLKETMRGALAGKIIVPKEESAPAVAQP